MKTYRIIVEGTVQGVFFRSFIKEKAEEIGIKGFVRNLEDGRVEVVIEGKDEKVNEMVEACKKGAPHSQIKKTSVEEIKNQGFDEFKILKF
jgi:acylphosphatase